MVAVLPPLGKLHPCGEGAAGVDVRCIVSGAAAIPSDPTPDCICAEWLLRAIPRARGTNEALFGSFPSRRSLSAVD